MFRQPLISHLALTPLLFALAGPAAAEPEPAVSAMAEELARLRGEVEALNQELATTQEDQRAELRALASQRSDLELSIRREELRRDQLSQAAAAHREAVAAQRDSDAVLVEPLSRAIEALQAAVDAGLPYRLQERKAALDDLQTQLAQGLISAPQATSRLWQALEDELKLGSQNAVDRQVISLGGQDRLVEVARLGMVSLYFRAEDGQVGLAKATPQGWAFVQASGDAERRQIEALFESLKKQIRMGYFEVPPALPGGTR